MPTPNRSGSNTPIPSSSKITCKSEQSRFHSATLEYDEVDLKNVDISIGNKELFVGCDIKLKEGVRYGLIGRNGTGKTTLLKALSEKLIPGIPRTLRILLLSQIESDGTEEVVTAPSTAEGLKTGKGKEEVKKAKVSAAEYVVRGDKERNEVQAGWKAISQALESGNYPKILQTLYAHELVQAQKELFEADELANRRSGARGWDARAGLIKAEEKLKVAEDRVNGQGEEETETAIMDRAMALLAERQLQLDTLQVDTLPHEASKILYGLGFSEEMMSQPYENLSGGWRSRCSLAKSLLVQSDILLLDEPSNYLDLEAMLWLEHHLLSQSKTLVIVSHDQDFLDNVVEETIYIRNKKLKYFDGTPTALQVNERKEGKKMAKQMEAMGKKREHIEQTIKQGMASAKKTGDDNRIRMVKSRQKKLDERFGLEHNEKGHRFKLNRDLGGYHLTRQNLATVEEGEPPIRLKIPDPPELRTKGDLVHFEDVAFKHKGAKNNLLEGVTFTVGPGGRLSLIGANGQGKSTLVKIILGELKPTSGKVELHPLMRIGYFSQHSVEDLTIAGGKDRTLTALRYFMDTLEKEGEKVEEGEARGCLGSFGLQGKIASDTPVLLLSGGQKVRLAFALIVWRRPHMLLLDEITTHIDAATLEALAKSLRRYEGALILVTHDRWFNRVVMEGESPRARNEDEDDQSSSDSESDGDGKTGATYRVGAGKVKLMNRGIQQYVDLVEKNMKKRIGEAEDRSKAS